MSQKNVPEDAAKRRSRREFAKKAAFTVPVLTMLGTVEVNAAMSIGTIGEPLLYEPEDLPEAKEDAEIRRR